MTTQAERAAHFRSLHERPGAFVIPNPWDVGGARLLAGLGFEALATTSAGFAFSRGLPDGAVTRDQALAHCREIVEACDLPVSADLEGGFGEAPKIVAESLGLAAATGLAGCSIEDYSGRAEAPILDFGLALERIQAAVEAARRLPHDFLLTARAENYLYGKADFDDTVRRLSAFAAAGADVLYAPGLTSLEEISRLCAALERPVNVVMGLPGVTYSVAELAKAGVKRISLGSTLARLAMGALLRAGREVRDEGTFTFADDAAGFAELDARAAAGSVRRYGETGRL
jgi:2-methylisocitrate lyase-like PEP mutase family enzyme